MSEPFDSDTVLVRRPGWRDRVRDAFTSVRVRVLVGVATAGLLALLYLSQVAAVNTASGQLAGLSSQSTQLERQDADLHQQLGTVTSPAYIDRRARAMGLVPAPSGAPVIAVTVGHNGEAGGQP
ncbi:MAG TPA: hypothetical protein VKT52_11495 [Ktedonobacterales bacterium]|nr:hypothetical protein [Ktedonobacterales bacterium]